VLSLAVVLAACGPTANELTQTGSLAPDGASSDRELPLRAWVPPLGRPPGEDGAPAPAGRITIRDAVRRALTHNAAVKAAFYEMEAREGEAAQSSSRKNPELLLEVENFAGDKDKSGFDAAEETLGLAQTIELGDKRVKRLQAANLDTSLAGWDFETTRVRVATQTAQAFVDVLSSQQRGKVLGEFVAIAEKTQASVAARVKGGKVSPIELDRAVVASARAKALHKAEKSRLEAAKRKLSALWGAERIDFDAAEGRLGKGYGVPSIEAVRAHLDNNPELARWADEINRRVAQVGLEHANAVPDVTVGAGVRHFGENDSTAMVASVSVPFPVFDRNQGNIAAAERRVTKAEHDRAAARTELFTSLVEAMGELEVAATQLKSLERDVLPAAETAFDCTTSGYDYGKFHPLNVRPAPRLVFEPRGVVLAARADYEKARVRVEALIGRDLSEF